MRSWKSTVLALLAVNTAVCMTQCDGFLGTKMTDPYWNGLPERMNTAIAGLYSLYNICSITMLHQELGLFLCSTKPLRHCGSNVAMLGRVGARWPLTHVLMAWAEAYLHPSLEELLPSLLLFWICSPAAQGTGFSLLC